MWSTVSNGTGIMMWLPPHDLPKNGPVISATDKLPAKFCSTSSPCQMRACSNNEYMFIINVEWCRTAVPKRTGTRSV